MATKAELFRYIEERRKPKRLRPSRRRKAQRAADRATRNERTSRKGDQKATVVVEETRGRPSRKSTRTSSNGQRSSAKLEQARRMKNELPSVRHSRRDS